MTWQQGDTVPGTVTLSDASPTTLVVTLTSPSGVVTNPATSGSGLTRSFSFTGSELGRYTAYATVTGPGAGVSPVQYFDIEAVSVVPPLATAGLHATSADYARYIGGTLPDNLQQLLRRASLDVDKQLLGASYDDDDADVLAALAQATCEQVAYCLSQGWTDGIPAGYDEVSIGSVRLKRGSGAAGEARPAPFGTEAYTILQLAGLTGHAPSVEAW